MGRFEKNRTFPQVFVTEKKLIKVGYCFELVFEYDIQMWSFIDVAILSKNGRLKT